MKLRLRVLGVVFMLFASIAVSAERQDPQAKQRKMTIRSCFSISDANQQKLCFEEAKRRVARLRALNDLLAIAPGGGSTNGGASDCAAAAEADCSNHLDEVDTLEWDAKNEICLWSCRPFTLGPSSSSP